MSSSETERAVRDPDDGESRSWWEGATSRQDCPGGPAFHVHVAPAASAVALFVLAVVLGKARWFVGVVPVLLVASVVALVVSMRHLDPSSGGGG